MPEQLLLTAKPHNNHYLFSDYYLDNRVSERREWSETDVRADFEKVVGAVGRTKPEEVALMWETAPPMMPCSKR